MQRNERTQELGRIAADLQRIVDQWPTGDAAPAPGLPLDGLDVQAFARFLLCGRAKIGGFFKPALFGDPSFEILLELFACMGEGRKASITHVAMGAGVPATTALRWIARLEEEELIFRREDPLDRRKFYLKLTGPAHRAMHDYLVSFMRLGLARPQAASPQIDPLCRGSRG